MNREIKFRGKDEKGDWVYGYPELIHDCIGEPITIMHVWSDWGLSFPQKIDWNTLGQFTGFKDESGKEIYENDILLVSWSNYNTFYDQTPYQWICPKIGTPGSWHGYQELEDIFELNKEGVGKSSVKILGNTYDNSSLLSNNNENQDL